MAKMLCKKNKTVCECTCRHVCDEKNVICDFKLEFNLYKRQYVIVYVAVSIVIQYLLNMQ